MAGGINAKWTRRRSDMDLRLAREGVELSALQRRALYHLTDAWWDAEERIAPTDRGDVLDAFVKVANQSIARVVEDEHGHWVWKPVRHGQIKVRDVVRVRYDAYSGDAGSAHNSRYGPVVAIRGGDVHVMYEDGGPKPELAVRHSPYVLEKREIT